VLRGGRRADDDKLHQHVPGMLARQRIADVDAVTHAEIDRDVGQQIKLVRACGRLVLAEIDIVQRPRRDWRERRRFPRRGFETA